MIDSPQRHLFIIGFFRSGTSLLYSFLNLHPQIKLLFEADLLANSLTVVASRTGHKWWERLDFYNSCIHRHNLQPKPEWNDIRDEQEAAQLIYRQYGGDNVLYVGEKSPSYYNCLPKLAHQFPQARFVVLWRDPQAVVSSIRAAGRKHRFFRNPWMPLRSILGLEKLQQDTIALRAQGISIFDLCHEDLVENTESTLKSICDFLELPFDPKMLDLEKADCSMFPLGEHHAKAKSGQIKRETPASSEPLTGINAKIERYRKRWSESFGDQLASRRYQNSSASKPPGVWEIWTDQFEFKSTCLFFEKLVPVIYGFARLNWLKTYRRSRWFGLSSSGDTGATALKISVVTPSYKQLPWLKLCVASVADQQGVAVEHIIQDAQSGPELEEWVRENSKAQLFVEADSGMYDAINRGFVRATGDIVCWLNSDEQYLEGALAKVARYFEMHPEIDILLGDALLVGNTGTLLSYRQVIFPNRIHIQLAHLNVLSCATFVRRSVLERGFYLNSRWKAIADAVWVVELLKAKVPIAIINEPLAVFTITDTNLGQTSLAFTESVHWQRETLGSRVWMKPIFVMWHRFNKLALGAYWPRTLSIRLYTLSDPSQRKVQRASFLGFKWPHSV